MLEIWYDITQRGPGGANNPVGSNQHVKVKKAEVNHDNIILDQETPPKAKQGTSVEYGMRRLAKEASKDTPDSEKAQRQLDDVRANTKTTVHNVHVCL